MHTNPFDTEAALYAHLRPTYPEDSPSCQRPWTHATWRGIARRATAKRRRTW
jgi:hypothetical protein